MTELDPIEAETVLQEVIARFGDRTKFTPPRKAINFDTDLSPDQRKFVADTSRRKAILGCRRSGKSFVSAYYLAKTAHETPNTNCMFIGITRESAKEIVWGYIEDANNRYKLGAEANLTHYTWSFPNGSHIFVTGADDERQIRKYLGKGYALVIIDECGDFGPHLETMVKKILMPTLLDTNGSLVMVGTPGIRCAGYWYEITNGLLPTWSVYKWKLDNNPNLPQWRGLSNWADRIEAVLAEVRLENGYDEQSPEYLRQYRGLWVEGGSSLIYSHFAASRNTILALPEAEYTYMMGIDFGVTDASAVVVGAYSSTDDVLYIVESMKATDLAPQTMADIIYQYNKSYTPHILLADGNGIGKAFIAQIQKQYDLPLQLAEKKDKLAFIELLNDDFRRGMVKIVGNQSELLDELAGYQWANVKAKVLPDKAEDHMLDALLYMWRHSLHFKGVKPKPKPVLGSQEYEDMLVERELERVNGVRKRSIWHR